MDFRVLGPLEVSVDDEAMPLGAPKQRALLAALLLRPNQVVPVDRLIDEVWGDRAPRTAQHSVQLYVSELRKGLEQDGEPVIITRSPGYELHADPGSIDAIRFERLVCDGSDSVADDPVDAIENLQAALALWRGPAFADVAYDEFAQAEIRRLEELRLDAADALDEARLTLGDHRSVVAGLRKRVEDHPLREGTRGLYMQALAGSGRQADALRTFQDYRRHLGEVLGIEPGPELRGLEERVLLQDPTLQPASTAEPTGAERVRNPFKGLRPFAENDAADYYGRDQLIAQLSDALDDTRLLAVVGPSGSGKSSVVRAGLIPGVRKSAHRLLVLMVPGADPCAALVAALARVAPNERAIPPDSVDERWLVETCGRILPAEVELILVVDQFEELYTLSAPTEARRFLGWIETAAVDPSSRIRTVAVLRADYYDRPLLDPGFGALFTSNVVHVAPMSPADLEKAAVEPARAVGLTLEPSLLAELIADASDQPGGLPLYQFTLTELAERRVGAVLTSEVYRAIGGLRGALVGRAEEAASRLDPEEQDAARQLALRLVTVGELTAGSRRRVEASELIALDVEPLAIRAVLERFGQHRLLTFDRDAVTGSPTVEFAHDALLETWERLRVWIEESREDLRRRGALDVAIAEWQEAEHDPDYLPSGRQLETYETWRAATAMKLTSHEAGYLDAARDRASAAAAAEQEREETERRLQRRARTRAWALAVLTLMVVVAAVVAFWLNRPRGPQVALVFDGRGDQAFTDLLVQGWDRADRELTFRGEEVVPLASSEDEMRNLADSGYELVIGGGMFYASAIPAVAPEFPETTFVSIDLVLDEIANTTSIDFANEEGAFLAGAAAALTSRTGVVGFVGGNPTPLIGTFRAGFEAGAHHADSSVEVLAILLADDPLDFRTGFSRPDLGRAAGEMLYERGADVVFHAASVSGWGIVEAARAGSVEPDGHLWVIGVDIDQYAQASPEQRPHLLTSMVKRLDVAVETAVSDYVAGDLEPGTLTLGLAEEGLSLATSGGHLGAIAAELAAIESSIIAGEIDVPLEPIGPVLPTPAIDFDVNLSISYTPQTCSYEGPEVLEAETVARLDVVNASEGSVWLGVIPLAEPRTIGELRAPGSPDAGTPEWLNIHESSGQLLPPNSDAGVITLPLARGSYAVFCTAKVPYAAAVIEVR